MSDMRPIPVQAGGRVKPLDTFARESVRWVTGQERFQGRNALEMLSSWMTESEEWRKKSAIEIRHLALKDRIKLERTRRWFSVEELIPVMQENTWMEQVLEKQKRDEKLNAEEQEASSTFQKMVFLAQMSGGDALPLVPHPQESHEAWRSIHHAESFTETGGYSKETLSHLEGSWHRWMAAFRKKDAIEWQTSVLELRDRLRALPVKAGVYPTASQMNLEVHYSALRPFRWAWIVYGAAFVALLCAMKFNAGVWTTVGFLAYAAGIGLHGYGIVLRSLIAGRPPVTNMYESVVWVSFGAAVFGAVFEWIYRRARYFVFGSLVAGMMGLILADNLPNVLNPNLDPLVPVLRSNFWLTIHVLTITLSYAAFSLAMGIGHMNLWTLAYSSNGKALMSQRTEYLYRVLQVGVLLLATGTILGGVWANQSWGRFWGWDPKETMALVALLGYLVILHGRRAGWFKDFGTAVGSIVAYQGVLTAWYGVNFVLGQGLHSYGFGTGGVRYVMIYVALETVFIGFIMWKRSRLRTGRGAVTLP